jgi:glutamine amidotransferase
MCRLYGLHANEPTKVECTLAYAQNALLKQSREDRSGKEHSDGWGIACYTNGVPCLERRDTAAHQDVHFAAAAERLYARTVIAHIRRATVGGPAITNTHPFTHDSWTFAHNGTVQAFEKVRPLLEREIPAQLLRERRGDTDSELVFYWILGRMLDEGVDLGYAGPDTPGPEPELLADILSRSVLLVAELSHVPGAPEEKQSRLNFVLSNGRILVASRWRHTLFWLLREGIHDCEICGIPHVHHSPKTKYRAAIVASEPITHELWQELAEGTVITIADKIRPLFLAIEGA